MNTYRYLRMSAAVLAFVSGTALYGQTQYEAARMSDTDLNGTARFVGMGGAMGALGGDISTMSTNPAGIGIFRRGEVATSFSFTDTKTEGVVSGISNKENRSAMSFDQLGVVFSTKYSERAPLRYINFGVNYRKKRNFSKAMTLYGDLAGFSQTNQIAWMMNTSPDGYAGMLPIRDYDKIYNDLNGDYFGKDWDNVSWLSVLGIQGGLVRPGETLEPSTEPVYDENGNLVKNENGEQLYYQYMGLDNTYDYQYESKETGGVHEVDFNAAFNINDRVYLGFTLGAYDVSYRRSSFYTEWGELYGMDADYTLENGFKTEGTGVDLKLGLIWRPLEDSPFRMGFAVHTPTYYSLKDKYWASLYAFADGMEYNGDTDVAVMEYDLVTPWKFNFSLGHTLGTSIALGAEYEYTDYSSAELSYRDGYEMENENDIINEDLKGMHTLRLGVEAKLIPELSLRLGYNYSSAAFKKSAYKWLYPNDTRTDTEFENMLAKNIFTMGFGYRSANFYADAAFMLSSQKSEFYPFDDVYMPAADVKSERSQIMLTLGYRF